MGLNAPGNVDGLLVTVRQIDPLVSRIHKSIFQSRDCSCETLRALEEWMEALESVDNAVWLIHKVAICKNIHFKPGVLRISLF